MRNSVLVVCVAIVGAACGSKKEAEGPPKGPPEARSPRDASAAAAVDASSATVDPCSVDALKLTGAKELAEWAPPGGCTAKATDPRLVRSDADLAHVLTCPAGTAPPVDFTKQTIVYAPRTLTPSAQGFTAYDDGKTITVVTKFRQPCPGEPRPTPMPVTLWFVVPAGADRTVVDASCSWPCQ